MLYIISQIYQFRVKIMKKTKIFILTIMIALAAAASCQAFSDAGSSGQPGFFMPEKERLPRYEKLPPIVMPPSNALPSAIRRPEAAAAPRPTVRRKAVKRYIAVDGRFIPLFEEENQKSEIPAENKNNISTDFDSAEDVPFQPETAETVPAADVSQPRLPEDSPLPEKGIRPKTADLMPAAPVQSPKLQPAADIPEPQPTAMPDVPVPQTADTVAADETAKQVEITAPEAEPVNPDAPEYRRRYNQYLDDLQVFQKTGHFPPNQNLSETLKKMDSNKNIILFDSSTEKRREKQ